MKQLSWFKFSCLGCEQWLISQYWDCYSRVKCFDLFPFISHWFYFTTTPDNRYMPKIGVASLWHWQTHWLIGVIFINWCPKRSHEESCQEWWAQILDFAIGPNVDDNTSFLWSNYWTGGCPLLGSDLLASCVSYFLAAFLSCEIPVIPTPTIHYFISSYSQIYVK